MHDHACINSKSLVAYAGVILGCFLAFTASHGSMMGDARMIPRTVQVSTDAVKWADALWHPWTLYWQSLTVRKAAFQLSLSVCSFLLLHFEILHRCMQKIWDNQTLPQWFRNVQNDGEAENFGIIWGWGPYKMAGPYPWVCKQKVLAHEHD